MANPERDRVLRDLAEEIVVDEAERAAAGLRRLTVMHGLRADQTIELDQLCTFVDDFCLHHRIEFVGTIFTGQWPVGQHPRGTRWQFGPPDAAVDLATVRAALQERYPDWPIESDDY